MLSIKERQEELKYLGYYTGKIDSIEGSLTKQAYKKLQNDYFIRDKDKDGIYGRNTDILLINAYNVHKYCKNFKLEEFRCHCKGKYCTGYPDTLSTALLKNIQLVRNKYGATSIISPLRCVTHNSMQKGSSKTSKHLTGRALDFQNSKTKTLAGRKEVINYWFTLNSPNYAYCNGYSRYGKTIGYPNTPNMGSSVHGDVK